MSVRPWDNPDFVTGPEPEDAAIVASKPEMPYLIARIWRQVNRSPDVAVIQFTSPDHKRRFCEVWVHLDICRD